MNSPLRFATSLMERESKNIQSLNLYSELRSWSNISKRYAWSRSLVGRPACCLHEAHLDSWSNDHFGVRLKLLARCNTLRLVDGCCACGAVRIPGIQHFFFHCGRLQLVREYRDQRLATAFQSINSVDSGMSWIVYLNLDLCQKTPCMSGKTD